MIGAHTARALTDLGQEVVVTSHRRAEVPSFLAGRQPPLKEQYRWLNEADQPDRVPPRPRLGLDCGDYPHISEAAFEIARKIGAMWKSSARIRPLNFHEAPDFRVNPGNLAR
jgi:hypothetical protein